MFFLISTCGLLLKQWWAIGSHLTNAIMAAELQPCLEIKNPGGEWENPQNNTKNKHLWAKILWSF